MGFIKLIAALVSVVIAAIAGIAMYMEIMNENLLHAFVAFLISALFIILAAIIIRSEIRK